MTDSMKCLVKNAAFRVIKNRRSVRMFLDKPVSDKDLKIILHAAKRG